MLVDSFGEIGVLFGGFFRYFVVRKGKVKIRNIRLNEYIKYSCNGCIVIVYDFWIKYGNFLLKFFRFVFKKSYNDKVLVLFRFILLINFLIGFEYLY